MTSIAANLKSVQERIAAAAKRAGRDAADITLVAVSKLKPAAQIREAYEAGQRVFGENYAQELRDKARELSDLDINIEWHFIGHLQKNKAKYVAAAASWMESIDSIELAKELDKRLDRTIPCLIEVNVGDEASKSGVPSDGVLPLAREMLELSQLDLRGLMVLPPFDLDVEELRPYFQRLRSLLEELNGSVGFERPLTELSMGMTHDFETAIEEGATIVRVGTAIFGERE